MTEKIKILVVDDEDLIRLLFTEAFQKEGFEVLSVESAEEAMELLSRHEIPVMFLDINLPGMSGIELCRRIRGKHPRAAIYAVTGNITILQSPQCREAGFDDYFAKPVSLKLLCATVHAAIEKWKTDR